MPTIEEYERIVMAMKFYRAETDGQLILALLDHVKRLQVKIEETKAPIKMERPVREG